MTVPVEPAPDEASPAAPVTAERVGNAVVLRASGEVDYATISQLRTMVLGALAECQPVAVVDLLRVTFFGSAGLSLLVEAMQAAPPGTAVRVVASSATVLRAVELSGLRDVLDVYPTVSEALTLPSV